MQELLNQFYPPNKVIVRVSILFGQPKSGVKATKLKIHSESGYIIAPIKKITSIVLADNKLKLSHKVKKSTYQTIALAIPYDKNRGDKIILKQVPFHYAEVTSDKIKPAKFTLPKLPDLEIIKKNSGFLVWGGGILLALIIIAFIARIIRPKQARSPFDQDETIQTSVPSESEATATVKQIKDIAKDNPERLANLIKKWLSEEEQ